MKARFFSQECTYTRKEKVLYSMQHGQHRGGWGHALGQGRFCKVISPNNCHAIKGASISLIQNLKIAPIWYYSSKDCARTKGPSALTE